MYMYIIEKLHKPDERNEPTRTKLGVKYEADLEDIKGHLGEFCTVVEDGEQKKGKKKETSSGGNGDQHQAEDEEQQGATDAC